MDFDYSYKDKTRDEHAVIDLGDGLTIKMNRYNQSPRPYRLLLGDVVLAHGEEFVGRYTNRVNKDEIEWPITHYVVYSERAFVDQIMNKFRADRKAEHEASVAKFLAEAEQSRLAKEGDAILAIRKFREDKEKARF
jgi:hypothetical protein